MAGSPSITRRSALVGAIVSSAALAAPVTAAVTHQTPTDPDAAIQHHAWQLACALARKYDGLWEYDLFVEQSPDSKVVLFRRASDAPTGAMQLFK